MPFLFVGKKFVFDIRRTCRETYEHARRTLYRAEQLAAHANISSSGATISVLPSVRMPGINLSSASVPAALDILSSGNVKTTVTDEATLRKLRRRRRHRSSNSDEGGGGKLLRKEELEYGSNSASGMCYTTDGVRLSLTNRELHTSSGVLSLVVEDVSVIDDTDINQKSLSDMGDEEGYVGEESEEETQEELVERLRYEAREETQVGWMFNTVYKFHLYSNPLDIL